MWAAVGGVWDVCVCRAKAGLHQPALWASVWQAEERGAQPSLSTLSTLKTPVLEGGCRDEHLAGIGGVLRGANG